jgi:TM2 domain-containing membrane protein YozV
MKSKTTAGLLAIFLGGLGFHKFYLGQTGRGILYLVFCRTWIPSII